MFKSPAEIALMQRANDITLRRSARTFKTLKEGMTQRDLSASVGDEHTQKLGGNGDGALGDLRQVFGVSARQHSAAEAAATATSC